ncbi:protein of unknown function [Magnetospirillum gryphiswaldense MSR-1 v2]|uniref:Uncharacterized protein n=2 Tax=Magnetospirillum gryphiswaldense (strain DSM 6361 / JCM 21280 / NBRC 15271 / MSR-1) TaxID=431944 RepID=V6F3W6_MAGGM|nr:protein of unknown function [Magnetospirillum gryphiswaldense MSR-1 v2]
MSRGTFGLPFGLPLTGPWRWPQSHPGAFHGDTGSSPIGETAGHLWGLVEMVEGLEAPLWGTLPDTPRCDMGLRFCRRNIQGAWLTLEVTEGLPIASFSVSLSTSVLGDGVLILWED